MPNVSDTIPSFDFATSIEYDFMYMLDDGFFGIYCSTTDANSETIYKNKLIANNWTISKDRVDGFIEARSPKNEILMQFEYNSEINELDIYAMEVPITEWPAELVATALNELVPNTKTVIPGFECELYVVNNYIENYLTIAINGFGYAKNIVDTYKSTLVKANWTVTVSDDDSSAWLGISSYKDVQVTFYIDEEHNNFSVDIQKYIAPVSNWPTEDVAALVKSLGGTGTILPYNGEYSGVRIDTDYYPASIMVSVTGNDYATYAANYNQMLVNNGYEVIGTLYGDNMYCYPGTTICYRAVYLVGKVITIEITTIDDEYIVKN